MWTSSLEGWGRDLWWPLPAGRANWWNFPAGGEEPHFYSVPVTTRRRGDFSPCGGSLTKLQVNC